MTSSLQFTLCVVLAVYAMGEPDDCRVPQDIDVVSVLQVKADVQPSFLQRRDSVCTCLKWKPTYQNASATCGKNPEFYFTNQKTEQDDADYLQFKPIVGEEFCTRFYETLDANYCVNVNMGVDQGQWCLVDSSCTNLNGGGQVRGSKQVSWKKCAKETDSMLRHYSPEELATLADTAHLDLGLLHKMSYPLYKDHLWKDVASFWQVPVEAIDHVPLALYKYFPGPDGLKNMHQWIGPRWGIGEGHSEISVELRQEMQKIVDSGVPHSFDMDGDNHPPHMIVHGTKVYLMLGKLMCVAGCK